MLKKLVPAVLIVFVVFYLATDPDGAAAVTRGLGNAIGDFFRALGRFLENLFSGSG